MRSFSFVCVLAFAFFGIAQLNAAEAAPEHKKPAKGVAAKETLKQLNEAGKTKKAVKELPDKVSEKFHHDGHFGHDGIKAMYSVGKDLWWVEVTDGGKDFLLEYDSNGTLLALAWENAGTLVILTEGDDGSLWAVDDEGNAIVWH